MRKKRRHLFGKEANSAVGFCSQTGGNTAFCFIRKILFPGHKQLVNKLREERGSLTLPVEVYFWFALFLGIILLGALFNGLQSKAYATFAWANDSVSFAARAANMDGNIDMVVLRTSDAREFFNKDFANKVEGVAVGNSFISTRSNYFPGPIELKCFDSVTPGEQVPGGIARQPGYIVELEVPIFRGDLPVIGSQYITVPMRAFGVVKSK